MGAVLKLLDNERMLSLIRRTVAKDCNPAEFDWFIQICKGFGLDPLRRQIYAFVFHAKDEKKRQMVPVVSIGGLRAIAERTGNYRPDDRAARIEIDPAAANKETNPLGIVRAEVTVYKRSGGEWFPVLAEAYWEEFAPLVDEWKDDPETGRGRKTGRRMLDPKKDGWHRMPRLMIAKCAEALALRKAWPDDFAGVYEETEIDRGQSLDLTPSELADEAEKVERLERIGGPGILVDWCDGEPLQKVTVGRFGDSVLEFISAHKDDPDRVRMWEGRNRVGFREYWGHDSAGALAVKKALEDFHTAQAAE